jgi:leucyl-tRNA synthetase
VPVPDDRLPVVLPEDCVPDGSGNPLNRRADFVETRCPRCGGPARRETDTMDTFVDSSWYYARYCSPDSPAAMVDERVRYWMPVDQYVGGIEHAILHLLYSRFWSKVMRDLGLVAYDEPFERLLTQGMVLNHIFLRRGDRGGITYFAPEEVEPRLDADGKVAGAVAKSDGGPVEYAGVGTMSKSKRNGVDPQALIERYGADTARLFTMFAAPPEQSLEWSDSAVEGASRFLKRLWKLVAGHVNREGAPAALDPGALGPEQRALRRQVHETIAKVGDDIGRRYTFNTAIAAVMELVNALGRSAGTSEQGRALLQEGLEAVVLLLSPIVPHVAHVLWRELGHHEPVIDAAWPRPDPGALARDTVELVVQVNGKVRGRVSVPVDASQAEIEARALAEDNVRRFLGERPPRKVIVVPGKLVNLVA